MVIIFIIPNTPFPAFPHVGDRPVRKQPFGCFQGGARLSDGLRGNLPVPPWRENGKGGIFNPVPFFNIFTYFNIIIWNTS
jgi:hypothetical protein